MDDLQAFYESLNLETIRSFVKDQRQEDLHLDFKLCRDGKLSRDDRRQLAKIVSGFGNSDGGVVVWGVNARKDADGVDAAGELKPLTNARQVHSQFESLTGQCTSPVVEGVMHRVVGEGDEQFVATYVPSSDGGPYMAKLGEDRYFKRSGDSTYRTDDVAEMFGRRRKPRLSLSFEMRSHGTGDGPDGPFRDIDVVFGIRNSGRAIARFPAIGLLVAEPYGLSSYGLDGNRRTGLRPLVARGTHGKMRVFGGGADDVVHVDSVLEVTLLTLQWRQEDAENLRYPQNLKVVYRISAQDVPPEDGVLELTGKQLVENWWPFPCT